MAKPFRSDKRKKEILRLKKQEEKRQRRFGAKQEGEGIGPEGSEGEFAPSEEGQEGSIVTDNEPTTAEEANDNNETESQNVRSEASK